MPMAGSRLSMEIEAPPREVEGKARSREATTANPHEPSGRWKMFVFVGILSTFVIIAALHAERIEQVMSAFVIWCETLGYGAAILICLATFVASLAMIPCFPLMLASGGLFANMYGPVAGIFVGTVSVFIGLWTGSVAAFVLGRYVFADFAASAAQENQLMPVVSGMISMQGRRIVFLARMTPIIPGEIFNYACSAIPTLSVCDYSIGCIGSILPVSVWVGAGAQAESVAEGSTRKDHRSSIIMGLNVVGMAVLVLEFRRAYTKYKQSLFLDPSSVSAPGPDGVVPVDA